jgi:2-keto-3-deoxy-L-rhamnonate aldolase RhmA
MGYPATAAPYPLRKNRLRELLEQGQPSLGTHVLSAWPTVTELVGQSGQWDYVEFVAEYAPWTMHDLDNLARAIELFPDFTGMIKIEQETRGHLAMRAIGSGIQNVLFADVRTAEDARRCVRSVRAEHPDYGGLHGAGMRRDARTLGHVGSAQWVKALADSVIILMIEKKIESALRHGVHPRAEIGDPREAAGYLELGVRHFCVGHDVLILHNWWLERGHQMRSLLAEVAPGAHIMKAP